MTEEKPDIKGRIISTLIFVVLAGIGFFFYTRDKKEKDYYYNAYFNEVQGLQPSSEVQISGVRVGKIASVELTEQKQLKVIFVTQKGIRIKQGTIASLSSGGLTGEKIIELTPGKGQLLEEGATVATNLDTSVLPMSVRIKPMMEAGKFMLRSSDSALRAFYVFMNAGLLRSATTSLIYLEEQTRGFAALSAKYNKSCNQMAKDIHDANVSVANLAAKNKSIDETINNTDKSTTSLAAKNIGNSVKSMQSSFASLSKSLKGLNSSEGTLGKMATDKKPYQDLSTKLDTLNSDLKETYESPTGFTIFGSSKKK